MYLKRVNCTGGPCLPGYKLNFSSNIPNIDLSILKPLRDFIRLNNIDIIHTHGPRANIYGAFLKRLIKRPWLLTVHSSPHHDFLGQGVKGKLFTGLHLKSFQYADHILAVSDRFKQGLD